MTEGFVALGGFSWHLRGAYDAKVHDPAGAYSLEGFSVFFPGATSDSIGHYVYVICLTDGKFLCVDDGKLRDASAFVRTGLTMISSHVSLAV
jgi:hypothetical protein